MQFELQRTAVKVNDRDELVFEPTAEFIDDVYAHAKLHLTSDQIRTYYGYTISDWSLMLQAYPRLQFALERGGLEMTKMATTKLYDRIERGDLAAITFYLKTKGGWVENVKQSVPEKDKLTTAMTLTVTDPIEAAKIYKSIMCA